jgi:hypothetical protein
MLLGPASGSQNRSGKPAPGPDVGEKGEFSEPGSDAVRISANVITDSGLT